MSSARKPTVEQLGIDVGAQRWRRSSDEPGALEVAFVDEWVLLRVADDPAGRILVYDHDEWDAFLDGARNSEFDDAARPEPD